MEWSQEGSTFRERGTLVLYSRLYAVGKEYLPAHEGGHDTLLIDREK